MLILRFDKYRNNITRFFSCAGPQWTDSISGAKCGEWTWPNIDKYRIKIKCALAVLDLNGQTAFSGQKQDLGTEQSRVRIPKFINIMIIHVL